MTNDTPAASAPRLIANRYRLGQSLGRGTFGEVYYAEDIKFKPPREVALKLLHPHYVSDPQVCEDIAREASILARFDHPNILQVLDFDVSQDLAFIVTKLASGGSLAQKIRPDTSKPPNSLPLSNISRYLEQIASGLDEAHNHGLIHRDIKPLNILLDSRGQILLADFGLAAMVSSTGTSSVMVETKPSGTPHYMAPEQWEGQSGKASDIYALGVLLYQMITGQTPYQGNVAALMAQHRNAPIPKISEKATRLRYPPALDELIASAMDKDPRKRLKPARELFSRFKAAMDSFTVNTSRVTKALVMPSRSVAGTRVLEKTTPENKPEPLTPAPPKVAVPSMLETLNGHTNYVLSVAWSPDGKTLASGSRDNTVRLWSADGKPLGVLYGHTAAIWSVAWSREGKLASGSSDNSVRLWTQNGQSLATLQRHKGFVNWVAWSPDGKTLASVSSDRTLRLWSDDGRELAALYGHSSGVMKVVWSPDGTLLATACDDRTVRLWGNDGRSIGVLSGHYSAVAGVAWSPDSRMLVSASSDNTLRTWSSDGKAIRSFEGHSGAVRDVAWSPNGKLIASASNDSTVRLWTPQGDKVAVMNGHENRATCVAWSPDGNTLASASDDSTMRLWTPEGKTLAALKCHTGFIYSIAWSPHGTALASSASDGTIQLWRVDS